MIFKAMALKTEFSCQGFQNSIKIAAVPLRSIIIGAAPGFIGTLKNDYITKIAGPAA